MKKILILGGTRYVGKALLNHLLKNKSIQVDVLSRRKIEGLNTIIGDRKDQTLLNNVVKKDYDYIIDFIGYCLPDAKKLIKALSLGSYKTKIIFISTTYVYNKEQRRDCFKEDTFNPYDYVGNLLEREQISYEEGKRSAESYYCKNYLPEKLCILRFPIVLGIGDYTQRTQFFPTFFRSGGCLNQLLIGGTSNYIFVEDIKDLLSTIIHEFKPGIFNFSRPEGFNQYNLGVLFHYMLEVESHDNCKCIASQKTPFYYDNDLIISNEKITSFFNFKKSFEEQLNKIIRNESSRYI